MHMSLSELRELMMGREAWHAVIYGGHKESDTTEWLNWTELKSQLQKGKIGKKNKKKSKLYEIYLRASWL